jgi:hypothetical protein
VTSQRSHSGSTALRAISPAILAAVAIVSVQYAASIHPGR